MPKVPGFHSAYWAQSVVIACNSQEPWTLLLLISTRLLKVGSQAS